MQKRLQTEAGSCGVFSNLVAASTCTIATADFLLPHTVSMPANKPPLPRVIVAEDHPVCLLVLEDQLKGIGGCEVVLCENGADALRALESGPAALLLTDLSLPGIEGLALARRIRTGKAGQVAPDLPIVAITATAGPEERLACLEAGIGMVLTKQVSYETLQSVLGRYLWKDDQYDQYDK